MADAMRLVGPVGSQETGNPVLDSVVNLICSRATELKPDFIKMVHAAILEIAEKEPGGLSRRGVTGLRPSVPAPKTRAPLGQHKD